MGREAWPLSALLIVGIFLFNSRAAYFALAGTMALVLLAGAQLHTRHALIGRLKLLFTVSVVACLMLVAMLQTTIGSEFVQRSTQEIAAAAQPSDDPTSEFRLLAWAEAISRFHDNPYVGEGYGTPFTFSIYNDDPRPHNTYLTILYKMGVVGFIPFAVLLATFFFRAGRALFANRHKRHSVFLYILLLGVVAQCLNGVFNYMVESPFMASIFWLSLGTGFRMVLLLEAESEPAQSLSKLNA
jgi:O-antigen ligase